MPINIELNEWQTSMLQELFDEVQSDFDFGKPSMLVAQIHRTNDGKSYLSAGIIKHEKAKKIQKILGSDKTQYPDGKAREVHVCVPDR